MQKKYGLEKNPVIRVIEGNVASEKDMLQTQKTHILNENMTQWGNILHGLWKFKMYLLLRVFGFVCIVI